MNNVVMVIGLPASGKSTLSRAYVSQGFIRLNRDTEGGRIIDLVPKMVTALKKGKSVVLDNLFPTIETRKPFIQAAKKAGVSIQCQHMTTSAEDCSINALFRMHDKHGEIPMGVEDFKEYKDPNTYPIVVIFKARKSFEKPSTEEGFDKVNRVKFERRYNKKIYKNKAVFFDYDGTLRAVKNGKYKFPTKPEEVVLIPGRREALNGWSKDYHLIGVSNQSGIARGQVSEEAARACFERTNQLLGVDIDYAYCPHSVPPTCYCRKPQSGLGVYFIEKYKLDPSKCMMVGDQKTDKTFAERLGFLYEDYGRFFWNVNSLLEAYEERQKKSVVS